MVPTTAFAQDTAAATPDELAADVEQVADADEVAGEAVDDERARAAYQRGRALFEQRKYEESAEAFDEAYQLSKRPLLLLSIASAHERAGRFDLALRCRRARCDVGLWHSDIRRVPDVRRGRLARALGSAAARVGDE